MKKAARKITKAQAFAASPPPYGGLDVGDAVRMASSEMLASHGWDASFGDRVGKVTGLHSNTDYVMVEFDRKHHEATYWNVALMERFSEDPLALIKLAMAQLPGAKP
jgi:hypothetical protein